MTFIPKQNAEAERAVLGAVLLDAAAIARADLSPDDFYSSRHKRIWEAMLSLHAAGDHIDVITLGAALPDFTVDIADIGASAITAANISYHADIVREAAQVRKVQRACVETLQAIEEGNCGDSDELSGHIHQALTGIVAGRNGHSIVSMQEVAKDTISFIDRRYEDREAISGIPSGFPDIDALTDGFQGSDLIILAARPSMGKSALAFNMADNAAEQGFPVGILSLEMGRQQLGLRSFASTSGVEMLKLRKGILSRTDYDKVADAAARLAGLPVYFDFASFDIRQIRKAVMSMHNKGAKMIYLDYLQLARNGGARSREREIGEISTELKQLAKTLNIPIMALSQLSREVEKREDKRPRLSDLRDSGQIEQDADVVMFLYRENAELHQGVTEVIFAKGRNIGLGTVRLFFDGDRMIFRDCTA